MAKITLKDGSIIEVAQGATALDAAIQISEGLGRAAMACEINGKVHDLTAVLPEGCTLSILTFNDEMGRWTLRHTAAHILAQAVRRLYPQVVLAIGPAIDNGFYYDFDIENAFTAEDLTKIEAEMKKIVKENIPITRSTMNREDAIKFFEESGEIYKKELVECLPEGEEISLYTQGDFTDLCAGPHLPSTGKVKAFRLTSATGAYWRGDSTKKMLNRIYGTAFTKNSEMEEHLAAIEEAKKRDHNKIGRELEYFTTVDTIGQGLPVLLPNGAKVIQLLERFVEDEEERRGYLLTKTPYFAKREFYKISGHWDHYREGMFVMGDAEDEKAEVFALRPMTCPFQFQAYLNKMRSYRDLPLRYNETSTLFRNESSGEMHGLIRLRQFTISEGHLACRPDQLEQEFAGCVELAKYFLDVLGLEEDISYRFSKWDENNKEKYIGSKEEWESVQNTMRTILDDLKIDYKEEDGEAAFYGPKLDLQIKNVHGKEDTLITVQIDFQLAERFGMEYIDSDGSRKFPYVIHRTSIGCYERTLALLLEKYAGALPLWLAPMQVKVLPLTDRTLEYSKETLRKLQMCGFRCEVDDRSEKLGYKIREAQLQKIPYMLVLGDKEQEENVVAVRNRKDGETETMSLDAFIAKIREESDSKAK